MTSPITFITSDLLASSLLLSIIARSDRPNTFANALDLTTIGLAGTRDLEGDLFFPPGDEKNRPAILVVHGGGWREGDRKQLRGYGILLAREGFVCLCSSYRLSTEDIWPAQIQDINCAIRYLRSNSEDLGIDPDRIGISGNSAGAFYKHQ